MEGKFGRRSICSFFNQKTQNTDTLISFPSKCSPYIHTEKNKLNQTKTTLESCIFSVLRFLSEGILMIWITIFKQFELEPVRKEKLFSLFCGIKSQSYISLLVIQHNT